MLIAGKPVTGPLSAYAQADIINHHALAGTDGKTYAELGALARQAEDSGDTAAAEETLNAVASRLGIAASLERQALTGDPADVLAAADYGLLVIGNRGMAGFARVLGSTANTITHRATSNLLLVNTSPAAE